ncbi:unnamed protein product [Prorocentrum cordatum]|uniref:Peroxisomal membrane protein PEX16 n=1 Tax=Prorocentrum cordatum TaxID=2364126 RepID=A0ABN9V470_9DINO|nr:unnamed protein product [Polarella glacialis]
MRSKLRLLSFVLPAGAGGVARYSLGRGRLVASPQSRFRSRWWALGRRRGLQLRFQSLWLLLQPTDSSLARACGGDGGPEFVACVRKVSRSALVAFLASPLARLHSRAKLQQLGVRRGWALVLKQVARLRFLGLLGYLLEWLLEGTHMNKTLHYLVPWRGATRARVAMAAITMGPAASSGAPSPSRPRSSCRQRPSEQRGPPLDGARRARGRTPAPGGGESPPGGAHEAHRGPPDARRRRQEGGLRTACPGSGGAPLR